MSAPVYITDEWPVAVPLFSSSTEFANQCEQKIKFLQDFYLTCWINIIFYRVLTMELSTSIDSELVIMLLQQVVEKSKSMLLNKRYDTVIHESQAIGRRSTRKAKAMMRKSHCVPVVLLLFHTVFFSQFSFSHLLGFGRWTSGIITSPLKLRNVTF